MHCIDWTSHSSHSSVIPSAAYFFSKKPVILFTELVVYVFCPLARTAICKKHITSLKNIDLIPNIDDF